MAGAAARRRDRGRVRTMSKRELLRFWKLAPYDVEARVRRLAWAQTLLQDPPHHTQLITVMFGKLPSPVRACVCCVPAQSGGDEGAGTRTRCGVEVVLGEQRGEERTSAGGGARTALSSEAVQENRRQGRLDVHRVLPGPGHSLPRDCAGSSTAAAERGEEARPRPKRPPRARSIDAPNTDAREAECLAHRVGKFCLRMGELLRRGVLEPSMVYAFLMTKGGQQVPQPKSKAKARARSREMKSEGAEQTPDVSLPRLQLERPPMVFVRSETLEPSTARPKVRISRKSRPQSIGDPAQE